jgi:hypothetical protein
VERHPGHSHKSSELAEISGQPTILWESSLLAKTDFQPPEKMTECPGRFVSKLTPTRSSPAAGYRVIDTHPVGVSLLTKAAFQSQKMQRLYRPLREQAHSHKSSELAEISGQPTIPWESSLLAKTDFQPPEKVAECTGPFASKVERHPGHSHTSTVSLSIGEMALFEKARAAPTDNPMSLWTRAFPGLDRYDPSHLPDHGAT